MRSPALNAALYTCALSAFLLGLCGWRSAAHAQPDSGAANRVVAHAAYLTKTIGPRPDSDPRAAQAAGYIQRELESLGLSVAATTLGRVLAPAINVGSKKIRPSRDRRSIDVNLTVEFAANKPGPAIVFIAHYDTVAESPGATDNAVAVGVMLELARTLAVAPPARPTIILFTAAEEIGLLGARRFLRDNSRPLGLVVSIDLFGFDDVITLNGLSELITADHLRWFARIARENDIAVDAPPTNRVVSRWLPQIERSDHGPFTMAGIAALHLYNRGPDRIFLHYHQPSDDMRHVDPAAAAAAVAFVVGIASTTDPLPTASSDNGLWLPTPVGPVVVGELAVRLFCGAVLLLLLVATGVAVARARSRRRSSPARRKSARLIAIVPAYLLAAGGAIAVERISALSSGHPSPWVHSPTLTLVGGLAIAGTLTALIIAAASRWVMVLPGARYAVVAFWLLGTTGGALLAVDAHELAVLPITAAALIAAGTLPRLLPARAVLQLIGVAVTMLALQPSMMREAVFHGFYPAGVPLLAVAAVVFLAPALVLAGLFAALPRPEPGVRRFATMATVAALAVAVGLLIVPTPRCSGADFENAGLLCELGR